MNQWKIVSSEIGYNRDGFPVGHTLVRHPEDIQQVIEEKNISDPVIDDYLDFGKKGFFIDEVS